MTVGIHVIDDAGLLVMDNKRLDVIDVRLHEGLLVLDDGDLLLDEELHDLFVQLGLVDVVSVNSLPESQTLVDVAGVALERHLAELLERLVQGGSLQQELLAGLALSHLVLGVELVAVLLQVLLDLLHLVLGQQAWRTRTPRQLTELVNAAALEDLALEVPDPVGVVNLMTPPRHSSDDIPAGRIPLNIGTHEVLLSCHRSEVGRVNKLQNSVHRPEAGEYDKLSGGRPEDVVGGLTVVLLQQHRRISLLKPVE